MQIDIKRKTVEKASQRQISIEYGKRKIKAYAWNEILEGWKDDTISGIRGSNRKGKKDVNIERLMKDSLNEGTTTARKSR